ncbi:hypothetical protein NL108_017777 [Boleophthalmus pectinirostris]|nr:hypothetical protein NL108_017777 [Boleophthalmus pectinirostris]
MSGNPVNPALYCPRIQGMVNITIRPNTTSITSLGVFTIFLHGLFSTIGIVENLLILIVVGFRVRRSIISIWILNLATSDLLATASLPVFTLFLAAVKLGSLATAFAVFTPPSSFSTCSLAASCSPLSPWIAAWSC